MGRILGIVVVVLLGLSSCLVAQDTTVEAVRAQLIQGGPWRSQTFQRAGVRVDSTFWRFTPTHLLLMEATYTTTESGRIVRTASTEQLPYTLRQPNAMEQGAFGSWLILCLHGWDELVEVTCRPVEIIEITEILLARLAEHLNREELAARGLAPARELISWGPFDGQSFVRLVCDKRGG